MTDTVDAPPVPLGVLADPWEGFAAWERHMARMPLSPDTKRSYLGEARTFLRWVCDEQVVHRPDEVLTDPLTRDYATRDYRQHMMATLKRAPKGIDTALTGIDALFRWTGMGPADVKRVSGRRDRQAPKALDGDQQKAMLRAGERRGVRDFAIVAILLGTGLRVGELHALDAEDVLVSARRGEVHVRYGKGGKYRKVHMSAVARDAVTKWLAARRTYGGANPAPALFITSSGKRLAVRSLRHVVGRVGEAAGVDVHPHTLRHTLATNLLQSGADIGMVADTLGHESIETTRIYTRSTDDQLAAAFDRLPADY